MELRPALLVVVAACSGGAGACSGGKPKVARSDDAKPVVHPADAAAAPARDPGPPGKGDVSIRVEWHDVPLDARTPGPCGPVVSPTTTWGIPDAVIALAGSGASPSPQAGRVVVDRCITPRVQVAAGTLAIASGLTQPISLTFDDRPVLLPIAGHEVIATLAPGRHTVVAGDAHAWVIDEPLAAVTDATGVAVLRDVPTGTYAVTVWLPTANRSAKGEVTVTASALAEVTLQLQPSP